MTIEIVMSPETGIALRGILDMVLGCLFVLGLATIPFAFAFGVRRKK